MNLYLLRAPVSQIKGDMTSILVRAKTERQAREHAASEATIDEHLWLKVATCEVILSRGNPITIIKSNS